MDNGNIIHVVGTGTIGDPLVCLLFYVIKYFKMGRLGEMR
jgi:hypothetical protein